MTTGTEVFDDLVAIVEIPAGSDVKIELDPDSGSAEVDRPLPEGLRYPVNYGSIPGTLAPDGDPLDVLVLDRFPIPSGTVLTVRPISVLCMVDSGKEDPKVVAVPSSGSGPINGEPSLSADERRRIEDFFRRYKDVQSSSSKRTDVAGWKDGDDARAIIAQAVDAYVAEEMLPSPDDETEES